MGETSRRQLEWKRDAGPNTQNQPEHHDRGRDRGDGFGRITGQDPARDHRAAGRARVPQGGLPVDPGRAGRGRRGRPRGRPRGARGAEGRQLDEGGVGG